MDGSATGSPELVNPAREPCSNPARRLAAVVGSQLRVVVLVSGSGTNLQVPKRGHGYAVTRFTGARPGRYTFECNRLCGAGHDFMRGVIIVRPAGTGEQR
jgi:hypothetical protein